MLPALDFKQLFDASPNPYMLLDAKLRYVAANAAYLAVTGSKLEEILGRYVVEAFPHDEDHPDNENSRLLAASFNNVLRTKQRDVLALIHYRVPTGDGGALQDRFWSASHTPILDANGDVSHILQHTVDVTEVERLKAVAGQSSVPDLAQVEAGILGRARHLQATNTTLLEEVDHLRGLFEQAPGFICVLRGRDHVFEIANAAYRKLVGDRELRGRRVRDALPEVEGQGFYELLDRVFETGKPFVGLSMAIALENEAKQRYDATLDFVYQPIFAAGSVIGIFVQGNDITEQRKAEVERERLADERDKLLRAEQAARAEAERANSLKDDFLATVSHELRTPLTGILGWMQMLRSGQLVPDRHERALETIDRNARALGQLVEDILDVSRIMSGKMQLEVEPVRVMNAVEAAVDAVRPAADARGIRLQSTLDSNALVMGDAGRLQQVVWNLVSNAVKFTPKGGRVQIIVERRESSVAISVLDTGSGIAPEFLPHVFERFRQAEGGSTRQHGGLGLGLAIAKHLVELHGGTITAESLGIGSGALFTVTLPVALTRQKMRSVAPEPREFECPPELAGLRVLVVEDENDTRELLREILSGCGSSVEVAGSVSEGLEAFRRSRPDILISDIGMPDEDGYSFIRRIRALPAEEGGRIPAIALTAFARTEDRTAALRAGFRAHVPKPIDLGELLAVIASLAPSRR